MAVAWLLFWPTFKILKICRKNLKLLTFGGVRKQKSDRLVNLIKLINLRVSIWGFLSFRIKFRFWSLTKGLIKNFYVHEPAGDLVWRSQCKVYTVNSSLKTVLAIKLTAVFNLLDLQNERSFVPNFGSNNLGWRASYAS